MVIRFSSLFAQVLRYSTAVTLIAVCSPAVIAMEPDPLLEDDSRISRLHARFTPEEKVLLNLNPTSLATEFVRELDGKIRVVTDYSASASYQLESPRFPVQGGQKIKVLYDITVEEGGVISFGLLSTERTWWYGEEQVLKAGSYQGVFERLVPTGEAEASLVFRNYHLGKPGQSTFTINDIDIQQEVPEAKVKIKLNPSIGTANAIEHQKNGTIKVITDHNEWASYQLESDRLSVQPGQKIKVPYNITVEPGGVMVVGLLNTNRDGWFHEQILKAGSHNDFFEVTVPEGEHEASLVLRNYHLGTPGQTIFTINSIEIREEEVGQQPTLQIIKAIEEEKTSSALSASEAKGKINLNSTGLAQNIEYQENGTIKVTTDTNNWASYQLESPRFLVQGGQKIKIPYTITVEPDGIMAVSLLNTNRDSWFHEQILKAGSHNDFFEVIVPAGETLASLVFRNYHLETAGQTIFTIHDVGIQQEEVKALKIEELSDDEDVEVAQKSIKRPIPDLEEQTDVNQRSNWNPLYWNYWGTSKPANELSVDVNPEPKGTWSDYNPLSYFSSSFSRPSAGKELVEFKEKENFLSWLTSVPSDALSAVTERLPSTGSVIQGLRNLLPEMPNIEFQFDMQSFKEAIRESQRLAKEGQKLMQQAQKMREEVKKGFDLYPYMCQIPGQAMDWYNAPIDPNAPPPSALVANFTQGFVDDCAPKFQMLVKNLNTLYGQALVTEAFGKAGLVKLGINLGYNWMYTFSNPLGFASFMLKAADWGSLGASLVEHNLLATAKSKVKGVLQSKMGLTPQILVKERASAAELTGLAWGDREAFAEQTKLQIYDDVIDILEHTLEKTLTSFSEDLEFNIRLRMMVCGDKFDAGLLPDLVKNYLTPGVKIGEVTGDVTAGVVRSLILGLEKGTTLDRLIGKIAQARPCITDAVKIHEFASNLVTTGGSDGAAFMHKGKLLDAGRSASSIQGRLEGYLPAMPEGVSTPLTSMVGMITSAAQTVSTLPDRVLGGRLGGALQPRLDAAIDTIDMDQYTTLYSKEALKLNVVETAKLLLEQNLPLLLEQDAPLLLEQNPQVLMNRQNIDTGLAMLNVANQQLELRTGMGIDDMAQYALQQVGATASDQILKTIAGKVEQVLKNQGKILPPVQVGGTSNPISLDELMTKKLVKEEKGWTSLFSADTYTWKPEVKKNNKR